MTFKQPLISIIIPVYNVEQYLRECLDSVLAQTYPNLEIILINDGSQDNSGKICDEYAAKDGRVQVIHQLNQGVSAARNAGLKVASGEYIGFVDSDDYIQPDMYEYLYQLISKDNADVAMCNTCQTASFRSDEPIQENYTLIPMYDIFNYSDWMFLWNKLFSKSLTDTVQLDLRTSYGEDAMFIFELAKKDKLLALGKEEKYFYRQNPTSAQYIFKPSHLNKLFLADECLAYAKQKNWTKFYNTRLKAQFDHISLWLCMLACASNPDVTSLNTLISYTRQHCFTMLRCQVGMKQKGFLLLCCVNFPLARFIYKILKENKK